MSEQELRRYKCCFTGHRPIKLTRSEVEIRKDLEKGILDAIDAGITTFISGMAKGVDIWAAEIVLKLKKENSDIKLICALPNPEWLQYHRDLCADADEVVIISKSYHPGVYQLRNQWMVNHSSRVIAVFNGQPGGTKNTIDYADQIGVPVHQVLG